MNTSHTTHRAPTNAIGLLRRTARLGLLIMALFSLSAQADSLSAQVDRQEISANETLELTLRYDQQALFEEPDFKPLHRDFEVVYGPSREQRYSIVNGQTESFTIWTLGLQPKRQGTLVVPGFELDGNRSNPISITVTKSTRPSQASADNPVFMETLLDKKQLYVQEQLLVTYRIYMASNLQNLDLSRLELANAEVIHLSSEQFHKRINDINYRVLEIKFALFPQQSGELVIPKIQFTGYLPRGGRDPLFGHLFPNGKRFTLLSDTKTLTVAPQPASWHGAWLPADGVALSERWSGQQQAWRVGEPLTRHITITGSGTTAAQLPTVEMAAGQGHRLYPDQPSLEQNVSASGVVGTRVESIAIVPSEPGTLTLPPVRIEWWDSHQQQRQVTELAGRTFTILPAEESSYTPPVADAVESTAADDSAAAPPPQWPLWISLLANGLLAALVFRLWRRPVAQSHTPAADDDRGAQTEKQLFATVRTAATDNNASALRAALLLWARHYWPQRPISTLDQLGALIGDPYLHRQLKALDRSLYGRDRDCVDCAEIGATLKRYRANGDLARGQKTDGLRPLYPS